MVEALYAEIIVWSGLVNNNIVTTHLQAVVVDAIISVCQGDFILR